MKIAGKETVMAQYTCLHCKPPRKMGNTKYPGQSKGAIIRHLKGEKSEGGHEMSLKEAQKEAQKIIDAG